MVLTFIQVLGMALAIVSAPVENQAQARKVFLTCDGADVAGWSTEYFKTAENETNDSYAICLAWILRPTP